MALALHGDVADLGDFVHPSVHDHGGGVGGEDDLHVGVEAEDEVDELLLPFHVQAHLGLVHEEHIVFLVFHEHGEQDDEDLLLTTGELVGQERLADLCELDLVFRADDLLAGFGEEAVPSRRRRAHRSARWR